MQALISFFYQFTVAPFLNSSHACDWTTLLPTSSEPGLRGYANVETFNRSLNATRLIVDEAPLLIVAERFDLRM
jgi:hypothetical protein